MKRITFLVALCFGVISLSAQIEHYVIGNAGGQMSNSTYDLTHSLGDLAGTSISDNANFILVQGFPQCQECNGPPIAIEAVYAQPLIRVFPNPTPGLLHLEGEARQMHRYELYGPHGQQLRQGELSLPQLDISDLSTGLYLLRVYDHQQELTYLGKIQKQ